MADEPTGQHPLDRLAEEFVARFRRGERPAVSEYVCRYPELADQIPDVLQALALMEECGPGEPDAGDPQPRPLGDYQILREVGRGGMGIVYEAEQISLGRRVALKVLPFAATLDARQLQRFKNEVQAAAHLHHQHIVPVYAVGCERGVHYYAMQLIDGQTLAATVGELRQLAGIDPDGDARGVGPRFRTRAGHEPTPAAPTANTAWLGAAAAVTKRSDQDPAFFRTVARLGVEAAEALEHAHQQGVVHRDVKPANLLVDSRGHLWVTDFGLAQVLGDPRLTMTGDLVGTLRYMSPEQALAKPVGLDHRTDVYSLGATLYELLTLRPAFPGRDRQELLRQIAFDEPPPPRRVNTAVPADLETIVLRAMAKLPEERFASAQELADDLRRFLDDRPVQARRPTLAKRLKKWARRHQAAVLTAGVALVAFLTAAVAALAVSNALIRQERDRANANANATGVARAQALDNQHQAFAAADRLLTRVAEWQLRDVPQMEEARRTILEDALEFYQGFFRKQGDDPDVRQETGKAYTRTVVIYQLLGQPDKAEAACRQALAIQEALAAEFAGEPRYRHDLADSFNELGKLLRDGDRVAEAEAAFRRALDVQESLAREHPSAAVRVLQSAILHNLAYLERQQGRLDQSLKSYLQVRGLLEQLLREDAGNRQYTERLALAYNMLGIVSRARERSREAQDFYRKALELVRPLADDRPDDVELQKLLARVYNNLGLAYIGTRDYLKAEETLRESLPIHEPLFRQHPKVVQFAVDFGGTYGNLGKAVGGSGDNAGALEWYDRAVPILEQAVELEPRHTTSRYSLFATLFDRAQHLARLGRPADAARDWARLVEVSEGQSHITMRVYRVPVLARLGEHARATAEAEALVAEGQADGANLYHFAYAHALCAAAARRDERLAPAERDRLAERYGARAVELLARARAAGHFRNPDRVAHLQTDDDMDAIRVRPDFQLLLADIEAKSAGPGSPPAR